MNDCRVLVVEPAKPGPIRPFASTAYRAHFGDLLLGHRMHRLAVTALAVGLFTASAAPAFAGNGVKSLKFMPRDTNVVINVNVNRLRGGKALDELLAQIRQNNDFKDTEGSLKDAGVNLKRDLDTITLGLRADGKGDPAGMVVVAEGRFAEGKIVKAMKKKNADFKRLKHKGSVYYKFGDDGAMTFSGKTMIMAEADRITEVMNRSRSKGKKSAAKSRLIKGLLSKTDTKRDVWFIGQVLKTGTGVPMADKLKTVSGSIDMLKGLGVVVRISFADTATPKDVVSQFSMLRGMAASNADAQRMGLDVVADKAVVVADEKDVLFTLELTAAEAEKLKGLAQTLGGAM